MASGVDYTIADDNDGTFTVTLEDSAETGDSLVIFAFGANLELQNDMFQTGAEIKLAYEGEEQTNAFTDAEKTKLSNMESGVSIGKSIAMAMVFG